MSKDDLIENKNNKDKTKDYKKSNNAEGNSKMKKDKKNKKDSKTKKTDEININSTNEKTQALNQDDNIKNIEIEIIEEIQEAQKEKINSKVDEINEVKNINIIIEESLKKEVNMSEKDEAEKDEVEIIFANLDKEESEDEYNEVPIIELTPNKKNIKSQIKKMKETYNINLFYEKEIAFDGLIALGSGFIVATDIISKAAYNIANNLTKKK